MSIDTQVQAIRDAYAAGRLTDEEMEEQIERALRGQPLAHPSLPMFEAFDTELMPR